MARATPVEILRGITPGMEVETCLSLADPPEVITETRLPAEDRETMGGPDTCPLTTGGLTRTDTGEAETDMRGVMTERGAQSRGQSDTGAGALYPGILHHTQGKDIV